MAAENIPLKRIAALTMVRNDDMFLRKWVDYYGERLGRENLYVYFDGEDQQVPEFCRGVNTRVIPRQQGNVVATDRARAAFISGEAARLFGEGYDMALGMDVDEFLVVDPERGIGLREFLSGLDARRATYSGLGVDVGQIVGSEPAIDPSRPFLSQRSRGWLYPRYTKATILTRPEQWGSGFHRVRGRNFHIVKDLYLIHLGGVDIDRIKSRLGERERVEAGWSRHLKKRARTILTVSRLCPRPWRPTVGRIALLQSLLRPIFAWNKPSLWGRRVVVEIPERFRDLV